AALNQLTQALAAGQITPDAAWQQGQPISVMPGGGAQTVAASKALYDAVQNAKSRLGSPAIAGASAGGAGAGNAFTVGSISPWLMLGIGAVAAYLVFRH